MKPSLLPSSGTGILPCWPLMYVMCRFPCVYKYPEIIYNPNLTEQKRDINPGKHKKHHKKKKIYTAGVAETLEFIECFNPEVYNALLQCSTPYTSAEKIVKKMINAIV